jgi:hypothetical protein
MNIKEKLKERKDLGLVMYAYYGLGFFSGISIGGSLNIIAYIVLVVLSMAMYFWGSSGPIERVKAKLFPSHPDFKPENTENQNTNP